jgi:hypothetical protein
LSNVTNLIIGLTGWVKVSLSIVIPAIVVSFVFLGMNVIRTQDESCNAKLLRKIMK